MPSSSQILAGRRTRRGTTTLAAIKQQTDFRVPCDLEPASAATTTRRRRRRSGMPAIASPAGCGSSSTSPSGGRLHPLIADDPGSLGTRTESPNASATSASPITAKRKGMMLSLLNNLPPVMFLVCKYREYKHNQQQLTIRKVTERELLRLNHKIVSPPLFSLSGSNLIFPSPPQAAMSQSLSLLPPNCLPSHFLSFPSSQLTPDP